MYLYIYSYVRVYDNPRERFTFRSYHNEHNSQYIIYIICTTLIYTPNSLMFFPKINIFGPTAKYYFWFTESKLMLHYIYYLEIYFIYLKIINAKRRLGNYHIIILYYNRSRLIVNVSRKFFFCICHHIILFETVTHSFKNIKYNKNSNLYEHLDIVRFYSIHFFLYLYIY